MAIVKTSFLYSVFYTQEESEQIGFKSIGFDVKISRYTQIYSPQNISIGDNVKIDDFCILSGKITLESHIHISAYVALYGAEGIEICDYSGISPKSVVYSAMDDFSGNYLIGPIHPKRTINVTGGIVRIEKFVQIGSNTVIFPYLTIGEGSVIGACSLVRHSVESWGIYCSIPTKKIKDRIKNVLKFVIGDGVVSLTSLKALCSVRRCV